jgi:hypothetical protein
MGSNSNLWAVQSAASRYTDCAICRFSKYYVAISPWI